MLTLIEILGLSTDILLSPICNQVSINICAYMVAI